MKHKLRIALREMSFNGDKKLWVQVWPPTENGFIPSFYDLWRIIQAIVKCERRKYATLPWDPARKVRQFLAMAVSDMQWEEIAKRCQIPIRDPDADLVLQVDAIEEEL